MSKANLSGTGRSGIDPPTDPGPSDGTTATHAHRIDATARITRQRALDARAAGDPARALAYARRSQVLHPDEPILTFFEAHTAFEREQTAAAGTALRRTVILQPANANAWRYLGIQDFVVQRAAAARRNWRRCAVLDPGNMATMRNLMQVERQAGNWDAAVRIGVWSTAIHPHDHAAAFDLGMLYLSLRRWSEGWPLYDRRIRMADTRPRPDRFDLPFWDGTPDPSLHLLVWTDQNVGDEMQFAQLIPELDARVGHVTLECDARLVPVFRRSFPTISVIARTDPPTAVAGATAQVPQGHLGRLLRGNAAAFAAGPRRWLAADTDAADHLRRRYRRWSDGRPVVGIAWKSANKVFQGKNVPLEDWGPILAVPGLRFLSLQYGAVTADLARMRDLSGVEVLHDHEIDALHDLDAFGAQLEAADLVISISNSTIHQACGLGRPVWAMLHVRPDWRWGVAGDDCPWFPSLRLYRQTERFVWKPVADAVATDLREWVAGREGA